MPRAELSNHFHLHEDDHHQRFVTEVDSSGAVKVQTSPGIGFIRWPDLDGKLPGHAIRLMSRQTWYANREEHESDMQLWRVDYGCELAVCVDPDSAVYAEFKWLFNEADGFTERASEADAARQQSDDNYLAIAEGWDNR